MEKKTLRLLIVDDSPDEVELAVAALRKAGYVLKTQRAQDMASMQTALEKGQWDAVFSEHAIPHFGAQLALDMLKRANLDIPFIVVTRHIKDPDLVRIMRHGAHDVILKNQPARIAPVMERELRVAEERRLYRQATKTLEEMEHKHRAIVDGSREAVGYCQDGMHIDANKSYLSIFGYENQSEMEGIPVLNLIDKSDQARFKEYLRKSASANPGPSQEFLVAKNDGSRFHAELAIAPIVIDGESCTQILVIDVSKRKAVENRLQYLNQHDPLTGLYNRHHFTQELGKVVEKVKRDGSQSALLYLDLTQLKEINDAMGHATGDRLLLRIARLVREKLGETTVLARFSGDEFTALLHGMNEAQLKEAVDSLLSTLKETTFTEGGETFTCNCTIGLAIIDKHAESVQAVLAKAYKASQRDMPPKPARVPQAVPAQPTTPAIQAAPTVQAAPAPQTPEPPPPETKLPTAPSEAAPSGEWRERLQTALEKDGFQLAYQPIVNLHGDPAEYFEVLLRLIGHNGELISPGQFMPAAEQLGLAPAVDRWVIRQAIQSLAALHRENRQASFFVNLCPAALKDPELLTMLQKQLSTARIKPEYLVLESDEPAIVNNPVEAAMFTQALKKIGCRFTVDNFGSNLATLKQLRDLPIDFLKISGELIRNLSSDTISQASLKAVIQLAKAMDKQTIAKFVENAEDLGILWNLGVDYVQGHYFQGAESQPDYEFSSETTLSSDTAAPNWAAGNT